MRRTEGKGHALARYDKTIDAAEEAPLDVLEWISGLAARDGEQAADSHGAQVARLLSGIDRGEALGGAFSLAGLNGKKGK